MSELALTTAPGISVNKTSLTVTNPDITIEEIGHALDHASMLGDTVRWWVGDLLLFAEARWGEEYAQLLDALRLTEHQVKDYRWVAEKVAPAFRNANLSFTHHRQVAALEPVNQKHLLAMAEAHAWPVEELKQAVRDHRAFEAPPRRPRQVVLPNEGDAARGVRTIHDTLARIGEGISPEARDATGVAQSMSALADVKKTVKRVTALEPLGLAVAAVLAAGVKQPNLPEPAVIVPSGPWDTLVAAYATATDGGA